jgi:hypothetical protein
MSLPLPVPARSHEVPALGHCLARCMLGLLWSDDFDLKLYGLFPCAPAVFSAIVVPERTDDEFPQTE